MGVQDSIELSVRRGSSIEPYCHTNQEVAFSTSWSYASAGGKPKTDCEEVVVVYLYTINEDVRWNQQEERP
jgi:hypothetical protein